MKTYTMIVAIVAMIASCACGDDAGSNGAPLTSVDAGTSYKGTGQGGDNWPTTNK